MSHNRSQNSAMSAAALVIAVAASPLFAQLRPPDTMPRPAGPAEPVPGAGLYRDLARGFSPITGANPIVTEESYGLRNALVTGNVFGGRGFRGSVGYTGALDFRDETGSEMVDQFLARAGGPFPTSGSMGPSYDRVRLGQELGMFEFRRTGSGVTPGDVTSPTFVAGQGEIHRQVRTDVMSRTIMTQSLMQDMAEPISVGMLQFGGDFGDMNVELSGLRGVSMDRAADTYHQFGLSFVDALSVSRDMAQGIAPGLTPRTVYRDLMPPGMPTDDPALVRRDPSDPRPVTSPVFVDIQRSVLDEFMQARRAEAPEPEEWTMDPGTAAQRLQESLAALRGLLASGETVDPDDPDAFDPDAIRRRLEERRRRLMGPIEIEPQPEPDPDAVPEIGSDAFIHSALRHGHRIETLTDAEQSRFRELVAEGEELLGEGKYFRAERVFSRALRIATGHPLASIGLAHSQLGAGLYLSAALTLRTIYASNPEMIDVRYAEGVRPKNERLKEVREDLVREIARERNRRTNGFLLAYIGHLLENEADVRAGLDAAAEESPGEPMIELLRRIWLEPAK